jgi:GT2 family glycosyltransferase
MRVAVVIPMWNQTELTVRCLASLGRSRLAPAWVIVVDNDSTPDPRRALEQARPGTEVLRQPRNLGFAGGCNAGIRRALACGADAVLLLNNDAIAEPALLGELVRALESGERIGAAGAKTLTDEEPPRIHAAYAVLTFNAPLVRVEGWLEPRLERFDEERDVDSVSGGAILLRREALEDVGLLDESFFAYHEDVDWCTRARRRGWRIRYVPAAVIRHRMHASTGGGYTSPIVYLSSRNAVLFVRKHGDWRQRLRFAAYTVGNLLKELPYRWRIGQLAGYRLRLRGLRDGLLGREIPFEQLGLRRRHEARG